MDLTTDQIREYTLFLDTNFSRLEIIIEGLQNALKHLYGSELSIDWWGTMDEKYECETIYRLAILAFESYIKSCIDYFFNEDENPSQYYKLEEKVLLIMALSNHITSKTENSEELLDHYNLKANDYPLYNGMKLLNENKDLKQVTKVLKAWRTQLVYIVYPESNT